MLHETLSPMDARLLLAIDPGSLNLGWAVLALDAGDEKALRDFGVIRTGNIDRGIQRQRAMMQQLLLLYEKYTPRAVVYEGYVFFSTCAEGENNITSAFKVHQIIGALLMLCQREPQPDVIELLPPAWGKELTGYTRHTKEMIASTITLRLGTPFHATDGGHHTDAIGLGLVGVAHWQSHQKVQAAELQQRLLDIRRKLRRW